jgi:molecular chaperone GrpE
MADEHEIPVKVVDRRWWARAENGEASASSEPQSSLKPTYVEELERKVAEKDEQVQEYLSKYRQASQEFEQARARMRKELARDAERNRREVLVGLLEVLDNLDRAVEAARTAGTSASDPLLQGVELVRQQFVGKLTGFGVTRIETANASFDPLLHEAVTVVPTENPIDEGRIVGVVRSGYRIGDDVLRPALVAVAKSGQPVD